MKIEDQLHTRLVLEEDGTDVEDDAILPEIKGQTLMLLVGDEVWLPKQVASDVQVIYQDSPVVCKTPSEDSVSFTQSSLSLDDLQTASPSQNIETSIMHGDRSVDIMDDTQFPTEELSFLTAYKRKAKDMSTQDPSGKKLRESSTMDNTVRTQQEDKTESRHTVFF